MDYTSYERVVVSRNCDSPQLSRLVPETIVGREREREREREKETLKVRLSTYSVETREKEGLHTV